MQQVIEINRVEDLANYRLAWNCLLAQTRGVSFFQSLDWLEAYWRHYGAEQRLRVLVVWAAGQPIGILPLVVREEPTRVGRVRLLTYPLHDWAAFYGPIGPNPTATLTLGLQHIRRTRRDWDILDLRWTNVEGVDRGRTQQAMRLCGLTPIKSPWMQAARIDLSPGWEAYWASRKSHWRTNVRRAEKKLAERGEVRFIRYRPLGKAQGDVDPRWDLYETCEQLAKNSWQGTSTTGTTLSHDEVRRFLREAHAKAADAGALDINLLLLDETPVAYAYNYHYQGQVSGLRMGFDAAVAREGAGTVLQIRMIQDSCERGDHTLDLGAQYLACKRNWLTHLETSYRYTHYPRAAWRAQALRFKRWAANRSQRVGEHAEAADAS